MVLFIESLIIKMLETFENDFIKESLKLFQYITKKKKISRKKIHISWNGISNYKKKQLAIWKIGMQDVTIL